MQTIFIHLIQEHKQYMEQYIAPSELCSTGQKCQSGTYNWPLKHIYSDRVLFQKLNRRVARAEILGTQ